MNCKGTVTALITPFIHDEVDEEGLMYNIAYQIDQGINGLLCVGSTGESPTLLPAEQERVISIVVNQAQGKIPVWVGTGTNCTKQTIDKTQRAKDLGADIALIVTPYYNKPSQQGIYRHFEAIAVNVDMPIVIYNNPTRCGTNIETSTLMQLADLPNILGVKEASGNIYQVGDILHTIAKKHPHFLLFSGDDALTLPMMALGASGVVSVVSNLVPAYVMALVKAAWQGKFDLAKEKHHQLFPLYKAACIDTNPVPIKAAMQLCGMPAGECRLPLTQMTAENLKYLSQILLEMQLMPICKV